MIALMSRVEIVLLSSFRLKLVERLQELGLLHMVEVPLEVEELPKYLGRIHLEEDEYKVFSRLEELDRTLGEIVPLLAETPSPGSVQSAVRDLSALDEAAWDERVEAWATPLREATREKASLQDNLDILTNYQHVLEQVMPALGGSQVKLGKGTRALVLSADADRVVERLEERFQEVIGAEFSLHTSRVSRKSLVALMTFPEDKGDVVSRVLSQEGITPIDMRDEEYAGATVGEILSRIESTIEKHKSDLKGLESLLKKHSDSDGASIVAAKSMLSDRLAQYRVQNQFAHSQMVTVVHAWTPSDRFSELEAVIEKEFSGNALVVEMDQEDVEDTEIPTLLDNPKIFKPFEVLLTLFRPPAYGTVDPTIMVAVSFIIFYGFIVGDVGYGLVIMGFAYLLGRKWGYIDAVRSARTIGYYMGASSIVFGVLYGEYFGDIFEIAPGWFHRGHDTMKLLIFSLYIGIFHIVLALVLGIRENLRRGHRAHAMERLGLLMGLVALIFVAYGQFDVWIFASTGFRVIAGALFIVGAILIVRALGLVMGAVGILEIMSLGGNVISYARLMALGVAAIAIADIANQLPGQVGPWIGVPAAILVHLLNILLSIASPTIHSLRLNFVEFMPKFYAPEGKGFTPFKKETVS